MAANDKRHNLIADEIDVALLKVGGVDQTSNITAISGKEATANKDASGGYAGLSLFKIVIRNAANTVSNFFTNATTVARTWTFQDRDGTIADDTDITAAKARANHTGSQLASTISDLLTVAVTFINKRITPRVSSEASNVAPSIDFDAVDSHIITAQAGDVSTAITWTGTPTTQQKAVVSITPTGAVRQLLWNSSKFEASFSQALPTETFAAGVRMDIALIYNDASGKMRCLGVS